MCMLQLGALGESCENHIASTHECHSVKQISLVIFLACKKPNSPSHLVEEKNVVH